MERLKLENPTPIYFFKLRPWEEYEESLFLTTNMFVLLFILTYNNNYINNILTHKNFKTTH